MSLESSVNIWVFRWSERATEKGVVTHWLRTTGLESPRRVVSVKDCLVGLLVCTEYVF